MVNTIQPVVLIVIKEDTRILLTRRVEPDPRDAQFHNVWQIPGGGMEFAETPEETAVREAREELGIDVEVVGVLPYIYTAVRGNWQGLLLPYRCRRKFPDQFIAINEEASEYRWVTPDGFAALPLTPFTRLIIGRVFDQEG